MNNQNDDYLPSLLKEFQGTENAEGQLSEQQKVKLGNLGLMTPMSNTLTTDFEQMTLDTSPKESVVNQNNCLIIDTIDEQEENIFKLQVQGTLSAQKHQSFKVPREQKRKSPKHKTCEPHLTEPLGQGIEENQDAILEMQSPSSNDTPLLNAQTLQVIKELWNSEKNESEYFQDIIDGHSIPQGLSYDYSYLNQPLYSPPLESQSPQVKFEPDVEMDLQVTSLVDQLWGNQIVSRKLQKMLEQGTQEQKELITYKLERISPQIEKDVFGNYVVQKIFECTNQKLQLRMFNKLKSHFYDLSKNNFGCRVMQKLIEYTYNREDLQLIVLQQLQSNMRSLIYDLNGNYVIFKMLETYDKLKMEFLIPIVEESFNYMGQQIYGCKIIHKVIQQYTPQQISRIIRLSVQNYSILSQTEYGNYVLQHILQYWKPSQEKGYLVQLVIQQFYQLSVNKYASNTVERALEVLGKQELVAIMNWLVCRNPNQYSSNFVILANHQYANYVIKKFLVLSDHSVQKYISDHLQQNQSELTAIKSTVHGII
ncbi:unnamed protein product (macronuclear) [Paramecium tetraurelia]|uniref:PUM-HD domain-containing protein n=1 Tax=Paramecium tetraurelia TaxID=5888 RepID=A0D2Z9_PARTE|nr:uncharacterized protein GSPATT00012901001 [Paramecium tetraurelia]CAK77416.1 unnamed protein product [Paramecium tetraurelia]|eukprot:XP_001444813.1 hypothetical protein (macronuclear) [Paramecium tetraurelia strain d4-2]